MKRARKEFDRRGFVDSNGVGIVAHSPLVWAKRTAVALFSNTAAPLVELPFMYERTLLEYVTDGHASRVKQMAEWVAARPEGCVVLVAHGQLFQMATGIHPDNVGVIECRLDDEETGFEVVRDLGVLGATH